MPAAGKVTVGLESHWPCVTDFRGVSTYRLMAQGMEMSSLHGITVYGTPYLIQAKTDEPIEMPFAGDLSWTHGIGSRCRCTLSPPGEYD